MKKQLLVAAVAALVASSAYAFVADRTVHNQSSHVIFVAWKKSTWASFIKGAKSNYQRILPGESEEFGVADRGSGMGVKGGWGNTIQVEIGGKIGKDKNAATQKQINESYKNRVNAKNKSMDKWKEAFVRDAGNDIEIVLSGELAKAEKED